MSKNEGSKRKKIADDEKQKDEKNKKETEEQEADSSDEPNESESEFEESEPKSESSTLYCSDCWEVIDWNEGAHVCAAGKSNLRINITGGVRELVESMIELDTYEEEHLRWCLRQLSERKNLWKTFH